MPFFIKPNLFIRRRRIALIILGILLIFLISISKDIYFYIEGKTAYGTVQEMWLKNNGYYPRIEFNIQDKKYEFMGNENLFYEQGTSVLVIYNPDKPQEARVLSFAALWGKEFIYAIIASLIWIAFITSISPRMLVTLFFFGRKRKILEKRESLLIAKK